MFCDPGKIATLDPQDERLIAFLDRLQLLFAHMDRSYQEAAAAYGFDCSGCSDNCCQSHFFHHTYVEYFYLQKGFKLLPADQQQQVRAKALHASRPAATDDKKPIGGRRMCALNFDGRCLLYPFRPMICRLHGIPSEFQLPGRSISFSPGCETFTRRCGQQPYIPFDRSRFYLAMADLEKILKSRFGLEPKIKMTVTEIILSFPH